MKKTEILNVRVPAIFFRYIVLKAEKEKMSVSEYTRHLLQTGRDFSKETDPKLQQIKKMSQDEDKFLLVDTALKHEIKKCYLLDNFYRLRDDLLRKKNVSKERKIRMLNLSLDRIKEILGEESEEFKEAEKWLITKKLQVTQ